MNLTEKIEELQKIYAELEVRRQTTHIAMKAIKKKIAKYETVLKHAQEIESVEEKIQEPDRKSRSDDWLKPLVNAEAK